LAAATMQLETESFPLEGGDGPGFLDSVLFLCLVPLTRSTIIIRFPSVRIFTDIYIYFPSHISLSPSIDLLRYK
jgi:hypothetical protein